MNKALTVSRLVTRARCARQDHLKNTGEIARVAVESEPEACTRGGVIHAGMAAAVERFPAPVADDAVTAACVTEAVDRGLGPRDSRIAIWARVALRAARALDPQAWRPLWLPGSPDVLSGGGVRGADTPPVSDPATGRVGGRPLVEVRLTLPLPDTTGKHGKGWVFSFKPDAVLVNQASGLAWLLDHKTKASFSHAAPWTELHLQSLLYVRALREMGIHVAGAVLYQILADEPTVPTLRKDGHLKETSWATDWPTACEAIARSADPNPNSPRYDKLRESIRSRVWQYPQEVLFTDAELDSAWDHLLESRDDLAWSYERAESIATARRLPVWRAVRASGRGAACATCDYAIWCAEDFGGRDPELLIGDSYRRGGDKYLAEVALTSQRADLDYRCHKDFDKIDTARARP